MMVRAVIMVLCDNPLHTRGSSLISIAQSFINSDAFSAGTSSTVNRQINIVFFYEIFFYRLSTLADGHGLSLSFDAAQSQRNADVMICTGYVAMLSVSCTEKCYRSFVVIFIILNFVIG